MTPRTRTLIFTVTVFLFFVTTIALTGYAQGYRIDIEHKRITKTGGFFIKAPAGSEITIDEKKTKKVNILGGGVLLSNLLPGKYNVKIRKPAYEVWSKRLPIDPGLTTEIRNILLVRKDPPKEPFTRDVIRFLSSPDQKQIALEKNEGIWLLRLDKKEEILLTKRQFTIVSWSPDSKRLLLEDTPRKYSGYHIENGIVLPLPGGIQEPRWHPQDSNKIMFIENRTRDLFAYDLEHQRRTLISKNVGSYGFVNSDILILDTETKTLSRLNSEGENRVQLTFDPLDTDETTMGMRFFSFGNHVFLLDKDGYLLRFDGSSDSLVPVANGVMNVEFSSLGKSLLYTKPNELWVLYLEDILVQPFRYKNQQDLIARFSEPIDESRWYTKDNEHIIFRLGKIIRITELDGRDTRNTVEFARLTNNTDNKDVITYNEKDGRLYFLDGEILYGKKIR